MNLFHTKLYSLKDKSEFVVCLKPININWMNSTNWMGNPLGRALIIMYYPKEWISPTVQIWNYE